jgi:catechol 2,3-dioxygenase-like lactoylglutathione lyase family enzyme
MTGSELSEMKTVVNSELAVAHLVFKVADLKTSCQFYSNLGLPPFATDEKVAIIELRGGTHLLLLSVDEPAGEDIAESLTGQFHKRLSEKFDLMIKGKDLDELRKYRSELISRGIAAEEIPDETFYGHYLFCINDPDGHGITIYTSHRIDVPGGK